MCSACDDTGLTFAMDRDGFPPIAICSHRDCAQGQRLAKVMIAIAQGDPIKRIIERLKKEEIK